jgi:glyoxylase-like metal-dependent hydrolase (beta-lactamase superfamily II)
VEPLSHDQYKAAVGGNRPTAERIGDELWTVALPRPDRRTFHTLSVVATPLDEPVVVVDPGWDSAEALDQLELFLVGIGRSVGEIGSLIVTHAHPDHLGLAQTLRERSGARVLMHWREQHSIDLSNRGSASALPERLAGWGVPARLAASLVEQLAGTRSGYPDWRRELGSRRHAGPHAGPSLLSR